MTSGTRFAIVTRDELWSGGALLESRLSHGEAITDGERIVATDGRDDSLSAACDAAMDDIHSAIAGLIEAFEAFRFRLVAEASVEGVSATIVVSTGRHSIVTTPESLATDWDLLRTVAAAKPEGTAPDYRGTPVVWRNGSAAVLLHEAAGHAAEHGHAAIAWPQWLSVEDEGVDLLSGNPPPRFRRASFRDVPIPRMTRLVARQTGAPFVLPEPRIEVLLVDGGSYEPLTETVTVRVSAADSIDGTGTRRLPPFEIVESRMDVARSVIGSAGEPLRYPGVVCSREGQELVVESFAPLFITVFGSW